MPSPAIYHTTILQPTTIHRQAQCGRELELIITATHTGTNRAAHSKGHLLNVKTLSEAIFVSAKSDIDRAKLKAASAPHSGD